MAGMAATDPPAGRCPLMTDPTATSPRVPLLSLVLGFGPAALLPVLAILAWVVPVYDAWVPVTAGQIWGAAILLFLAG
jgi:hypothetical protein